MIKKSLPSPPSEASGDLVIRFTTALAVLTVAIIAAAISFGHNELAALVQNPMSEAVPIIEAAR
jgi:hypothetical protein